MGARERTSLRTNNTEMLNALMSVEIQGIGPNMVNFQ